VGGMGEGWPGATVQSGGETGGVETSDIHPVVGGAGYGSDPIITSTSGRVALSLATP